jgi:hypothetical protein
MLTTDKPLAVLRLGSNATIIPIEVAVVTKPHDNSKSEGKSWLTRYFSPGRLDPRRIEVTRAPLTDLSLLGHICALPLS